MKKISSIEFLRFISAFMILIWHYQQFYLPFNFFSNIELLYNDKSNQPFYENLSLLYNFGHYGVDIFFVISGYVFSYVYLQDKKNISFKYFFINRFARLYPLHFLTLIIVLILQSYSLNMYDSFLIHTYNDLYHFMLNLFFISGWGFQLGPSFNGPIWSVSVELIIYAFFYFFIIKLYKKRFFFTILLFFIFILFRKFPYFIDFLNNINFEDQIINCGILFFEGVLVYFCFNRLNKITNLTLGIILLTCSLVGSFKLFIFAPSLLFIFLSFEENINIKTKKICNFLGNLTYGLYLWHLPIQILLLILVKENNVNFDIVLNSNFFFLYLIIVFIFAIFSYQFFEKKIREKIKNI